MKRQINQFYDFGSIRLDATNRLIYRDGAPLGVQPRVVETLLVLVKNAHQIVDKESLLDAVWHDAAVEEGGLKRNISLLRKALGDEGCFIETLPKRGYRFTAEVKEIWEDAPFHEIDEVPEVILQRRATLKITHEEEITDPSVPAPAAAVKSETVAGVTRRNPALISTLRILALPAIAVAALAGFYFLRGSENNATASPAIRTIAVLPLRNLNNNSQPSFALGLTDSLISRLGKFNRLTVRPFSAVEKFSEGAKDSISFGQELKTDAVLEGTIQTIDSRVRVNLRLVDVQTGRQLWTDSFEETASDILKLQDAISGKVAQVLLIKLKHEEELLLAKSATRNAEAYRLYLIGREKWMKREWDRDCLAFYRKAIELDANFALAYLGIADLYAFTYETTMAEDALAKAIELDPTLHEAYATRGFLQMFHRWDWAGAESSLRRAIELAPNSSKAHHWYGVYLSIRGRLDEAQREMETGLSLDPTALVIMTDLAELHYFKSDYERAESELQKVLTIDPNFLNARMHLVKVRYKRGSSYFLEDAEFRVFWQKLRKLATPAQEYDTSRLEELLAKKDEKALQKESEESLLKELKTHPEAYLALARQYSLTGEQEKCLRALRKAWAAKIFTMPFVAVDPLWETVRPEAGFQDVLRRMNL
jgi:TolB-like protein/DNA-binding winged helix-turn-helix (wHTH) protein/Tfp pilus assembly protein PilF